jgi:hypothetical protein
VIVATNDRAVAFRQARAMSNPRPRVATVETIDVARSYVAAHVPALRPFDEDAQRWRVTVSPAGMKLGRFTPKPAVTDWTDEQRLTRPYNRTMTFTPERAKRSTISAWSRESRARMSYVLKTLDFAPLFENHGVPALVTLTMPRNWEQVAPTPKDFKKLLNLFLSRYNRSWGHRLPGVWKLEFQRRGAPHLHILMTPPTHRLPGTGQTFSAWLAVTWAQICTPSSIDWDDEEQRFMRVDHELMGTSIDYSKGLEGHSPDMVAAYFSKHGLFGAKDYQNDPPELWKEAVKETGGVRFWGYWALKKAEGVIELSPVTPHYVNNDSEATPLESVVRRHMRKLAERQSYVRKTTVYRSSVNYETGEIVTRKRRVNRRVKWMNGQAGFISLPDGEASAYELARLLGWHASQSRPAHPVG